MRSLVFLVAAASLGCHGSRDAQRVPETTSAQTPAPTKDATRSAEDEYWEHTKRVFRVPVGESPALGPANALVTIVEFSEVQCASCARVDGIARAIHDAHPDDVRVVWKDKPLSMQPAAEPAAQAAREVREQLGEAAFWAVHDRIVGREAALIVDGRPDVEALVKIASEVGARAEAVRKAIKDHAHREDIEADLDLAEDLEVEGTPQIFVNGRRLEGAEPRERIERMVDEELDRGRALVEGGTPRESVYETLVARGPGPWVPRSKPVVALPEGDPSLGAADAKVTVHVWSDYQCALCVAVERMIAGLREEHGRDVRFVWHDLPLPRHRDARLFAEAAREAYAQKGATAFWTLHDQIARAAHVPSQASLDGFARALGLDMTRWRTALDGEAHAREIAADEAAAREEGIAETPAFLVVAKGAARGDFVGNVEYPTKLPRVVETALAAAR